MKVRAVVAASAALYLGTLGVHMSTYSADIKLTGAQAKAIQIACQEFEKKLKVSWKDYLVTIDETGLEFVVNFAARSASPELRGSPSGIPGFEIKIRMNDYAVESSQFSR
jgi:hypothetical protein